MTKLRDSQMQRGLERMSTKTVKVFGGPPPCSKCKNVERIFVEVAKESGIGCPRCAYVGPLG